MPVLTDKQVKRLQNFNNKGIEGCNSKQKRMWCADLAKHLEYIGKHISKAVGGRRGLEVACEHSARAARVQISPTLQFFTEIQK